MGVLRKGLFVTTGGLSGAVGIKANLKKERIAKALEAQNRPARVASAAARDSGRQFAHPLRLFEVRKLSPEDKVAAVGAKSKGANGRRNGRADDAMPVNGEVAGLSTLEGHQQRRPVGCGLAGDGTQNAEQHGRPHLARGDLFARDFASSRSAARRSGGELVLGDGVVERLRLPRTGDGWCGLSDR